MSAELRQQFFATLFEHCPPGFIELRLLQEKRPGEKHEARPPLAIRWPTTPDEAFKTVEKMAPWAAERRAGVFVGVVLRGEKRGTAAACTSGKAAWVDIDFRDFKGGEQEARERIASFPAQPSIVVQTGHGVHLYFLLRDAAEPRVLCALSFRLAAALGGDHCWDAPRVLRCPGTKNVKDPDAPIDVEIESFEPGRMYSPDDFDAILPPLEEVAKQFDHGPAVDVTGIDVDETSLPEVVANLLAEHPRIANFFRGEGKPAVAPDGKRNDISSSGYDFSLCCALIKKSIRDPSVLATALWHRPDGGAFTKGIRYIARTVRRSLQAIPPPPPKKEKKGEREPVQLDFEVESIKVFTSDPPHYVFRIEGKDLPLKTYHLTAAGNFSARFLEVLGRFPSVPDVGWQWRELVNGWMERAEKVAQPPEASPLLFRRQQVEQIIEGLILGDGVDDLLGGKKVQSDDGRLVFRLNAVVKAMRAENSGGAGLDSSEIGAHLRLLGHKNTKVVVGGKEVRAWVIGSSADEEEAASSDGTPVSETI